MKGDNNYNLNILLIFIWERNICHPTAMASYNLLRINKYLLSHIWIKPNNSEAQLQ